jgi:ribosomal protein S4E
MAANMDGVGTLEVGRTLSDLDLFTCYKKDIDEKELIEELKDNHGKHVAVTVGRNEFDYERLARINKKASVRNICIDVANGYTQALLTL